MVIVASIAVPAAWAKPPDDGPAANKAKTTAVQILSLNDFHGQLRPPDGVNELRRAHRRRRHAGGAEYLASYVRDARGDEPEEHAVRVGRRPHRRDAAVSAIFHDEPSIEAMNLMGLDYNGVGNHEFDEGAAELTRMQEGGCHPVEGCFGGDGFAGADFHFLAANVTYKDTGETIFPPYAIHEFPGVDIAVVGMTLEGTPSIVTAAATADIDFHDEADSVNALVPVLKAQGIETIIVLLHEGGSAGAAINEATINACNEPDAAPRSRTSSTRMNREIDLVVTGHTNWAVNCPDFAGTGIMVTGAASVGRLVTDTDLVISRATKEIVSATINNVIVRRDVLPAAPDITALINKYGTIAAPTENRVIGDAPSALLTRTTNAPGNRRWATSSPTPSYGRPPGRPGPRPTAAPAVISLHERRRHPGRHQCRADHLRRGVQRPAIRQRPRDDGHDRRADRRASSSSSSPAETAILQIPASLTYDRQRSTAAPATGLRTSRSVARRLDPAATYRVTREQLPRRRRGQLHGLPRGHEPVRR